MMYLLIASNLIMAALFILRAGNLPPQVPLFYSKSWGEEQLADLWMIILIPLLTIGFFIVNLNVYKKFFHDSVIAKQIIDYLTVFTIFIMTVIFIKIVLFIT